LADANILPLLKSDLVKQFLMNGSANVGESGKSAQHGLANVGESGESCIFPKTVILASTRIR
jgi:hypothetical protein